MSMIKVNNLSKRYSIPVKKEGLKGAFSSLFHREYSRVQALDSISFSIEKGELIGYIGPNGAGKSTTIKILSGILVPDEGECVVGGRIPWKDRKEYVRNIGVVFGQKTQLWWDLPVSDSFSLLKDIYSIPDTVYKRNLDRMTDMLALSPFIDTPVRSLSLGQRMRCDLAASLLHDPSILFLDEPTIGLDAVAKNSIRNFVREINKEKNVTIILTTHDMDDIEALSKRIIIIGGGALVFDGTMADLRLSVPSRRIMVLDFHDSREAAGFSEDIKTVRGADVIEDSGIRVRISFDPVKLKPQVLVKEITENYSFADISVETPPIEELIARIYTERMGQ